LLWWWPTWSLLVLPGAMVSMIAHARRRQWYRFARVVVPLALAYLWLLVVYFTVWGQNKPPGDLGRLALCVRWCGTPFQDCTAQPFLTDRPPATTATATAAVSFFRSSVFGAEPSLATFRASVRSNSTIELWATDGAGSERCRTALTIEPIDIATGHRRGRGSPTTVLLSPVPWHAESARRLAARLGYERVHLPNSFARCVGGPRITTTANALNAAASALRAARGVEVASYGCSVAGKIALWAAVTTPPGVHYSHVFADSGGTAGPSTFRHVGPCGEPFEAFLGRLPSWLASNASALPPVGSWPYDVDDLLLDVCHRTQIHLSSARQDLWNNHAGMMSTVERLREAGCAPRVVSASGSRHCDHFLPP